MGGEGRTRERYIRKTMRKGENLRQEKEKRK
jgi:hypothetical protein